MEAGFAREYLPFLPGWTLWVMYPIVFAVLALLAWGLFRRVRSYGGSWRQLTGGTPNPVGLRRAVTDVLLQRKVVERPYPAVMHSGIFYGMLLLAFGTTLVFVDEDILRHFGSFKLMSGWFYGLWEFLLDLAGLALLVGVALALGRRLVLRPPFLLLKRETLLILVGLFFLAVSGFLLEAYRLNVSGLPEGKIAFVGAALAALLPEFDGAGTDVFAYRILWWSHFAGAMAVIGAIGFTGLSHLLTIPANLILSDGSRPRTRLVTPFNLAELMESEEEDVELVAGTESTAELAPSARLAADACVACGRCHDECPAVASGRSLSPRDLVQELQTAVRGGRDRNAAELEAAVWSCTNCYACEEVCPAAIRHVDYVLDFRRALVDHNRLDGQKLGILEALDRNQNPYKLPSFQRANWLSEFPGGEELVLENGAEGRDGPVEWLYWLGCSAGFDSRAAQVAQATIRLFRHAGLSFGVLGQTEACCGEPAKRLGEEGRFQMIALENIEVLKALGIQGIVTHCPHCLNTLGHEYAALGLDLPILHHTALLSRLVVEGRLTALAPKEGGSSGRLGAGQVQASASGPGTSASGPRFVYHDPCNLARAEELDHEDAVESLLGGRIVRPEQSGRRTFCCGGGAGNMWYSVEPEETRISRLRLDGLLGPDGPDSVVTSCPFCLSMLTDAAGNREGERPSVWDVAEVLAEELFGGGREHA